MNASLIACLIAGVLNAFCAVINASTGRWVLFAFSSLAAGVSFATVLVALA